MPVLLKRYRVSNPGGTGRTKKQFRKGKASLAKLGYKLGSENYRRKLRKQQGLSRFGGGRRANPSKKRMSLAQKLHFGTARQRAAARLSLSRKRKNPSVRKEKKKMLRAGFSRKTVRAVAKGYRALKNRKRRKNVGEIVSISLAGLANPGKKRRNSGMAKRRKSGKGKLNAGLRRYMAARRRAKNPGTRRRRHHAVSHRRRRTNPVARRRHSRRRRNPVYAMRRINRGRKRNPGMLGLTSGTIGKALGVIGGAIGSKYITQLALGGNNTSYVGYAGNLAASIGLGWAAGKVTKSKEFGTMVMVGGIAALVLRVLSDMTPIGQYVNLSLAGMGKGGDTSLGIIQDSSFPVPQTFAPGSMTNAVVPSATRAYVNSAVSAQASQTAQMKAAGSKGMGYMMGGRKVRRAIM